MYTYDDINLTYDGIPRYSCDMNYSGWERCADSSGTATGGTYGVGASLKTVGLGSGVGAGDDLVGFAAKLPGYRSTNGTYYNLGSYLNLWSSTESSSTSAWRRHIYSTYSTVYRVASSKALGYSVRCLRNTDDTSNFTDPRDGNVYECVKIGKQVWMKKNLAYLPSVNTPDDGSGTDPKYYVYGNTGTDVEAAKDLATYQDGGVLYNWPSATASAPEGFHLPSDAELNELEVFVFNLIYKQVSYDGYTGYYQKHLDYGYAGESADRQLTITRTEIDTLNTSDTVDRQLEINRTATDGLSVSETVKKSLSRTVKDVLSVSDNVKKSLSRVFTDSLELTDKAFKTVKTTVIDTLNISDNASRLVEYTRTAIDRIGTSETFKHCKNGIELIWSRLTHKPTTTYNKTNKPTTSWDNPDKPNRC